MTTFSDLEKKTVVLSYMSAFPPKCPKCENIIMQGWRYCPRCGESVEEIPESMKAIPTELL